MSQTKCITKGLKVPLFFTLPWKNTDAQDCFCCLFGVNITVWFNWNKLNTCFNQAFSQTVIRFGWCEEWHLIWALKSSLQILSTFIKNIFLIHPFQGSDLYTYYKMAQYNQGWYQTSNQKVLFNTLTPTSLFWKWLTKASNEIVFCVSSPSLQKIQNNYYNKKTMLTFSVQHFGAILIVMVQPVLNCKVIDPVCIDQVN